MYHPERTIVFDHPNGSSFVISHDGTVPEPDKLLEQFGIAPEHRSLVVPFGQSRQRVLSEKEKDAERVAEAKKNSAFVPGGPPGAADVEPLKARIAVLETRLAAAEEQLGLAASKPAAKR